MDKIQKIDSRSLETLREISIQTFSDTFAKDNKPEDMENYLTKAYSTEKLAKELANEASEFYFIYSQDQLAGYIKLNVNAAQTEDIDENGLEIERIYIDSAFKRLGLGKKLYELALQRASELNKTSIWLGVWEKNFPAIEFYKKLGFTRVGQHAFFMGEDEQVDFIMQKRLTK
ncbi:GNAT family N-acetyltransferase [Erwinia sp. CPCC 100877]|nr:GNAT family N-acetyltransferase [Erwinia sp. CPCC 100877]